MLTCYVIVNVLRLFKSLLVLKLMVHILVTVVVLRIWIEIIFTILILTMLLPVDCVWRILHLVILWIRKLFSTSWSN